MPLYMFLHMVVTFIWMTVVIYSVCVFHRVFHRQSESVNGQFRTVHHKAELCISVAYGVLITVSMVFFILSKQQRIALCVYIICTIPMTVYVICSIRCIENVIGMTRPNVCANLTLCAIAIVLVYYAFIFIHIL